MQPSQNAGGLIEAGLPQHTHSGTTSSAGAHTHTAQSAGSHNHRPITDGKAVFTICVNSLNDEAYSFMPPFKYGYNPKGVSEMLRMEGLTIIDETPYSTGAENLVIYTVLKV